ncbi:peptidase inhibitor family I36 protein [Streptomyces mirabilis]|uniref:peptidase inhibitor family I36 protein n=1 Tax=Streptomyces mirabilis TaxID=68239 RepID=UPI0036DCED35
MTHTVKAKTAGPLSDGLGCADGYACFWVNNNYNGTMGKVSGNNTNYLNLSNSSGCTKYPGTWNDCISSIDNNGTSGCKVFFWTGANYSGGYHSLSAGDAVYDFGAVYGDPSFNDSISSNHWCQPS